MTQLTRREVIDRIIATAAAAAMSSPLSALAQSADSQSDKERESLMSVAGFQTFREFIRVSSALTGIRGSLLAPDFKPKQHQNPQKVPVLDLDEHGQPIPDGADPMQAVKMAYFALATTDSAYPRLIDEFHKNVGPAPAKDLALDKAASTLLASPSKDVRELARSIIMAWYFGVWYEWNVPGDKPRFTIVSADAYTQGWAWRIVQAHPAGYSNLRFGHWASAPPPAFDRAAMVQTGDEL